MAIDGEKIVRNQDNIASVITSYQRQFMWCVTDFHMQCPPVPLRWHQNWPGILLPFVVLVFYFWLGILSKCRCAHKKRIRNDGQTLKFCVFLLFELLYLAWRTWTLYSGIRDDVLFTSHHYFWNENVWLYANVGAGDSSHFRNSGTKTNVSMRHKYFGFRQNCIASTESHEPKPADVTINAFDDKMHHNFATGRTHRY